MTSQKINDGGPLLSVVIGTYQHANYIRECIESVLAQKTNFNYEIIIGEDESSDGTRKICIEYQEKYPEKIRLFLRSRSNVIYVGGKPTGRFNFIENLKAAKGKYIALLDGDDYWSDPFKLQKQIDVLEARPTCVACHHWQGIAEKKASGEFEIKPGNKEGHGYFNAEISSVSEIFKFTMRPQTRTLLFRNIFSEVSFPDWFYKVRFGDLALSLILGKYGDFFFIDKEMAVYRVTGTGASNVFNNQKGYISGNKSWMEIWACALVYHQYKFTEQALAGMNVFITRIRTSTNNSFAERLKLAMYILFSLRLKFSVKNKMIKTIMEAKTTTN